MNAHAWAVIAAALFVVVVRLLWNRNRHAYHQRQGDRHIALAWKFAKRWF